jgi:hypothetical protein
MKKRIFIITALCAVLFLGAIGFAFKTDKNKEVGPEGTNGNYVIAYDLNAWTLRQKWMNTGSINDSLIVRGANTYFRRIAPLSETLSSYATNSALSNYATTASLANYMSIPAANTAIATMQNDINGKVPNARTITINGTTQDLSANRTWNVGNVFGNGLTSEYIRGDGSKATFPAFTSYTAGTGIGISGGVITNTAPYVAPTFNNTATKTLNGAGVQISTTKNTKVSYSVTHTIALTLVVSSGSSMAYLEISPNNSTWTTVNQGGFSRSLAVAVALNDSQTTNLQCDVPAGWYVRIRTVTSGGGSASFTCGQEVQY